MLSNKDVIQATRKLVCVRPLSYEDKTEADWLRKVYAGRGGALENTVFAVISPDSKEHLVPPGRMPYLAWPGCENDPRIMVTGILDVAKRFSGKEPTDLPVVKILRTALNVGACDRRPVVVFREEARSALAKLAWKEEHQGQFVFVQGNPRSLVQVMQMDAYGQNPKVLAEGDDLESVLRKGNREFQTWTLDHRTHLQDGVRRGLRWKTTVPIEDRQSLEAIRRLWGG